MVTSDNVWDRLPTCGCGDPDSVFELAHWTLAMFAYKNAFEGGYYDSPQHAFKTQVLGLETRFDTLYWALLGALDKTELIEHGCSVEASWLTPRGEAVLEFLDQYGCESATWPDSSGDLD